MVEVAVAALRRQSSGKIDLDRVGVLGSVHPSGLEPATEIRRPKSERPMAKFDGGQLTRLDEVVDQRRGDLQKRGHLLDSQQTQVAIVYAAVAGRVHGPLTRFNACENILSVTRPPFLRNF